MRRPPTAPQSMRDVARGLHWSGSLRIGDTDWQVRAVPTAGGPLETTLRSRGRGADRRHAADAVAVDLSDARKPQLAAAVAGEPAGARARPDRHPDRIAEPRLLPRPARRAQRPAEGRRPDLLDPDARSRPLQERQRLARPRRRRCAAAPGGAAAEIRAARHRRAGAARRRRIRHHPGSLRGSARLLDRTRGADRQARGRAVPAARTSRRDRHQHRHRDRAGSRQRPGAAAEEGRPRALPLEIGGPQLLHHLRRGDVGRARGAQHAGRRSARRHRALPARGALPAVHRRRQPARGAASRRWCAGGIRRAG